MTDLLEGFSKQVENLKGDILFEDSFRDGVLDSIAEQEVLQAVHLLDCAVRCLSKALLLQRRALANSPARHLP